MFEELDLAIADKTSTIRIPCESMNPGCGTGTTTIPDPTQPF